MRRISEVFPLESLEPNYTGEVAERWRYMDGSGEIGFISSVTQAFCRDCTRASLSAEGSLYTCLFATEGTDLRKLIRGGASDSEVAQVIAKVWAARTDRYSEIRTEETVQAAQGGNVLHRRLDNLKRTDLAKNKGKKIEHQMNPTAARDRFGQGAGAVIDRREQRKRDQALGLVPFAVKLENDLIKRIHTLAQERNTGLNELVAELLKKGLGNK